jgi:hypothetical protein
VFGNGTGFVWNFDSAEHDEGAEGAAMMSKGVDHAVERVAVLLQESEEMLARFVVENETGGAEAVSDGVLRGAELSVRGGWAFREGSAGFRRLNSSK